MSTSTTKNSAYATGAIGDRRVMQVTHVVDTISPGAGSVALALRGFDGALFKSRVVAYEHETSESPIDVLHLHGLNFAHAERWMSWAGHQRARVVLSPLGDTGSALNEEASRWRRWRTTRVMHRILSGADVVACLDQRECESVRELSAAVELRELPYGCDFGLYESTVPRCGVPGLDDHRILLFLGPLHPEQGLVPLFRAIGELGHDFKGWKLVLAGPEIAQWRRKMEAALARKRVTDRVQFVTDPDVETERSLLAQAAVVVAPALRTQCPVTVLQALAAGVPVVASNRGLCDELADRVNTCMTDRVGLRDALRPLIKLSGEELTTMGLTRREAALAVFDWQPLRSRYLALYRGE